MWVNREECEYCEYHVAAALRQANQAAAAKESKKGSKARAGSNEHQAAFPAGGVTQSNGGPACLLRAMPRPIDENARIKAAAQLLLSHGYQFTEPDPNSSRPFAKCVDKTVTKVESRLPHSTGPGPAAVQARCGGNHNSSGHSSSAFLASFGRIDPNSEDGRRVMQAQALHAAAEKRVTNSALRKSLDSLAKRDDLTEKVCSCCCRSICMPMPARMASRHAQVTHDSFFSLQAQLVTSKKVNAVKCHQCGYLAERLHSVCREEGHRTSSMPMTKRWFSCSKCKQHVSVLNKRFPDKACDRCGETSWKTAGMKRSTSAPDAAAAFLPRGEEHGKFRGSAPAPPPNTGISIPSAGAPTELRQWRDSNAWQGTLPTHD